MSYYPGRDKFFSDSVAKFAGLFDLERDLNNAIDRYKTETKGLPLQGRLITTSTTTEATDLFGKRTMTIETGTRYSEDKDAVLFGTLDSEINSAVSSELEVGLSGNISGSFAIDSLGRVPHTVAQGGLSTEISGDLDKVLAAQKIVRDGGKVTDTLLDIVSGTKTTTALTGFIHESYTFATNKGEIGFKIEETSPLAGGAFASAELRFIPSEFARQNRTQASTRDQALLLIEDIVNKRVATLSDTDVNLIRNFMEDTANELIQNYPDKFTNDIKTTFNDLTNSLVNITLPAPQASYTNPGSLDTNAILNYTTGSIYEHIMVERLPSN